MSELQELTYMFVQSEGGGPKELLDEQTKHRYQHINLKKLVLIIEKYKNDKVTLAQGQSTGNLDVDMIMRNMKIISGSDSLAVAKKIRESIQFKK